MLIIFVNLFKGFSANARNNREGPSVINTNNKEGGYFVTFKNDKNVNTGDPFTDQGAGSP